MAVSNAGVPRLPAPSEEYDPVVFEQAWRVVRQWMLQVTSPSQEEVGETAIETTTATAVIVGLAGGTYLVDTTAGAVTVTLPDPSTVRGRMFVVKRITAGANTLTIQATTGNIDNAATTTIATQYNALRLKSDGVGYWLI